MLQPAPSQAPRFPSTTPNTYTPVKTVSTPSETGSIGRSIVIKGEVSGSEPLYIDGQIEGKINFPEHRVTIGRHGNVTANISAKEVVIMGTVKGNVECTDRVDIRAEGSLTGDVVTRRISVEDGAILKGSVQVETAETHQEAKQEKQEKLQLPAFKASETEAAKAMAAGASA